MKDDFTDLVYLDVEGKTKEEAFMNIALFARQKGLIPDEKPAYRRLLAHEKAKGTTAVGRGIACPEAPGLDDLARPFAFILCRTREPVEFDSWGSEPVRIILASLIKDKKSPGLLKSMARIAGLLRKEDFGRAFLKAKDEAEACLLLQNGGKWNQ